MVKKAIKSRFSKLKRLGVTAKHIGTLYATERRPHIRKRLRALRFVVLGKSPEEAAQLVKAGAPSVYRWIKVVREGGLEALTRDPRGQKPNPSFGQAKIASMREQIHAALKCHPNNMTWTRLTAVDCMLAGNSATTAARESNVLPSTVKYWLKHMECDGVQALVSRSRPKAPPKERVPSFRTLRTLAATERRPSVARRLRAMAQLAAEMSNPRDGTDAKLTQMWRALSRNHLVDAPRRSRHGRQRRLNQRQLERLHALIIARPEISRCDLCAFVRERFHVDYSEHWMGQIVTRQLGFERVDGRLTARE